MRFTRSECPDCTKEVLMYAKKVKERAPQSHPPDARKSEKALMFFNQARLDWSGPGWAVGPGLSLVHGWCERQRSQSDPDCE